MKKNKLLTYKYPDELYCAQCEENVAPAIEDRIEKMVKVVNGSDVPVDVSYKVAICPVCGYVLCDRDLDYAMIRIAKDDGLI